MGFKMTLFGEQILTFIHVAKGATRAIIARRGTRKRKISKRRTNDL
jgi:hypothetical protein